VRDVRGRGFVRRPSMSFIGAALMAGLSGQVAAFQFDTGDPDLDIRFDNTVKYNVGWRTEPRDKTLGDTWGLQAGEYKFDNGDIVTNRLDLLSEFDFIYKSYYGFRFSGAAWYDAAYDDDVVGNPAYQAAGLGTAYPGNKYTDTVKRYYTSSGELLDAFAFGRADIGEAHLDVKAGRHNIYWGESLFSPIHGVSYSQGPVDFRKAVATPGSEAKELFLPLNQVSAHLQVDDTWSAAAQYYLQWEPYRIYEGGTYFTYADPFFQRGTNYLGIPYMADRNTGRDKVPSNTGSWGANVKGSFEFGTVGLYYRKFDDKVPAVLGTYSPGLVELHNAYAEDVKLWGISLSKQLGGIAFGTEVVHRQNTALNTFFGAPAMARGDSWHALVNAIAYIGKTPVFDSATWLAELTYSKLDKVYDSTTAYFAHENYNCAKDPFGTQGGDKSNGCSTNYAVGLSTTFTPTWFQVFPSVDLTMPLHYDRGLKGNSPVPFGGNENSGTWSIGLGADYLAKYKFDLAYTDYFGDYQSGPNIFAGVPGIGPKQMSTTNGGNALLHDRGWLSFTFKTTF
jgi:uncharacterized protein DUF1302